MAEPVEVAIEIALLDKATTFAAAQSPALKISLPNVGEAGGGPFQNPTPGPSVQWLRATLKAAPSVSTAIPNDSLVQHYGILQIDVFQGFGGGELAPARLAAKVITAFQRGTAITGNGFTVQLSKAPYRGPLIKDDPWVMIPVSIPYLCFARPT